MHETPPLPLPVPARRVLSLLASREAEKLLDLVRASGAEGVTAAELVAATGLSQPTISRLLNELHRLGMLRGYNSPAARPGRPPQRWRMARSRGWSILALAARLGTRW